MIAKEDRDLLLQFAERCTEEERHGEPGSRYVKLPVTVAKAFAFQLQCIVLKDLAAYKSDIDAFMRQHEERPLAEETTQREQRIAES